MNAVSLATITDTEPLWKRLMKLVDSGKPTSFPDPNVNAKQVRILLKTADTCLNHQSLLEQQKIPRCKTTRENYYLVHDMEGHAKKCNS